MDAARDALADQVRHALTAALSADRSDSLSGELPRREVSMFGGRSFMVDGSMVVAAGRAGHLLVRIDPARYDELLAVDGARPAEMGPDRTMGPGWITVTDDGLATDEQLTFWIEVGLAHLTAQR